MDFNSPQHGYLNKIELEGKKTELSPNIALVNKIMDAMNDATKDLIFKLNVLGEIETLVNNSEVQKRWNRNKLEQLKSIELNIPELAAMFRICDEEFADLASSLQKNLLYILFFLSIGRIELTRTDSILFLDKKQVLSQFFQPHFIPFELYYQIFMKEDGFQLNLHSKINKEQMEYDFAKMFKDNFAEMSQSEFDFNYTIEGYYQFLNSGLLESAKIYVREQINMNCFSTAEYEFKLINN